MSLFYSSILSRLSPPEIIEYASLRVRKLIHEPHFYHDLQTVIRFIPTLHTLMDSSRNESFISSLEDLMGEPYGGSYIQRLEAIEKELEPMIEIWDRYPFLKRWSDLKISDRPEDQLLNEFYHEAFFTEPSMEVSMTLLVWMCELKKQYHYVLTNVEEYHELVNELLFTQDLEEVSHMIDSALKPILRI